MLITNDQHKPKGDFEPSEPSFGILQHRKTIQLSDDEGKLIEHSYVQFKRESSKCPIDQDLSAFDFSLTMQVKLGNPLERVSIPNVDRFDMVETTIATLHLLNSPEFSEKIDPVSPPETPIVESTNPTE